MIIQRIKRPWIRSQNQGHRYNPDPFYHTTEWKQTRIAFLLSQPIVLLPPINGIKYQNKYCAPCWRIGRITATHTIDHIQRIRAGGSRTDHSNMEGQCKHCHAVKSANEANE